MIKQLKKTREAIYNLLKRSETVKDAIALAVDETVTSNGFRLIEDHAKKCIEDKYKFLLTCPKDKLESTQTEISVLLDFFNTIYAMADKKWTYEGHVDPSSLFKEDEDKYSIYEKAMNEYNSHLDKINNQGN